MTPKKSLGVGLCASVLIAGCVSAPRIAEQPKAQPRGSVFVEESLVGDSLYHFASLMDNRKSYARILVTDGKDKDKLEFATRRDLNLGSFRGNGEVIGFTDSDDNYGIGLNSRGNIGDVKVGMALEKKVENDDATKMSMFYIGGKVRNSEITGGVSDINGNTTGMFSVDHVFGQNIIGAGVNMNGNGGYGTAVVGRFPEKIGRDFGYRAWTLLDSNGNYLVDFLASTKSTLSVFSHKAMVSPEGPLGPNLFENWFDPHTYLWMRTSPGGFAGNAKFSKFGGIRTTSMDVLYQFLGKKGVSMRTGLGYKVVDTGANVSESVSGNVGVLFSNGSYLDTKITNTGGDISCSLVGGLEVKF